MWNRLPEWSEYVIKDDTALTSMAKQFSVEDCDFMLEKPNDYFVTPDSWFVQDIKQRLLFAPGFVLIRCGNAHSDKELRAIYALYSSCIGSLNDRYGYFFDVVDHGLDYTKEAVPVSKTRAATGYHTDSTAKEYLPDVVGLLCLQPASSGGDSLITNAANLYAYLNKYHAAVISEMEKAVIRDVITPGKINTDDTIKENAFPIFSQTEKGFTFRYMRFWIETAFQKTLQEMPMELTKGLDATDAFFDEKSNNIQFRMERGDMLFINNRFLCHNRSAFENNTTTSQPRTLVRTWINFD